MAQQRLRTFFRDVSEDPRRCRVCGHYTGSSLWHRVSVLLAILTTALALYIILDIAENGHLDNSLLRSCLHLDWDNWEGLHSFLEPGPEP